VLLFWLLSRAGRNDWFKKNGDDPLEILKKRYVNGEIDKEEYEQKKKDLEK
jgi:uncharacterized membrane protein